MPQNDVCMRKERSEKESTEIILFFPVSCFFFFLFNENITGKIKLLAKYKGFFFFFHMKGCGCFTTFPFFAKMKTETKGDSFPHNCGTGTKTSRSSFRVALLEGATFQDTLQLCGW